MTHTEALLVACDTVRWLRTADRGSQADAIEMLLHPLRDEEVSKLIRPVFPKLDPTSYAEALQRYPEDL